MEADVATVETTVVKKSDIPLHFNKGIHPRVVHGQTIHPKVNTSKSKNPSTINRTIQAIESHLEKHPRDGMSQGHLSKLKKLV